MGFIATGCTTMEEVRERREAARAELVLKVLADLESTVCEYCHAPAGSPCMTSSGGIAHLSHKSRQMASDLARQSSWLSADVNRKPDNHIVYPEMKGKSWMEVREANLYESRSLIAEVVTDIAGTLSDMEC